MIFFAVSIAKIYQLQYHKSIWHLPVLAGKDGLEFRDTQQVRVRGDYEVGMFGQSGGQVETIIVNESIFL